jgi:hypothetical protein
MKELYRDGCNSNYSDNEKEYVEEKDFQTSEVALLIDVLPNNV